MDNLTASRNAIFTCADPVAASGKAWVNELFLAYFMKKRKSPEEDGNKPHASTRRTLL